MDIIDRLLDDHGKQRGLAGGIAKTEGASDERKRLWAAYREEILQHGSAEEQTLYATLLADPKGRHDAQHGVAEHKVMDDLVCELDEMDMSSSGWLTRFKTLRHKVEHHLEEEEEDVFPLARKLLSGSEREEMLETFENRKTKAAGG